MLSSILPKIYYEKVLTNTIPYGNILQGIYVKEVSKWDNDMEQKLKILIDETLELRRAWEQRRLEAENQMKALDAKLAAYQTALKDYWEYIDAQDK